jgi:CRP-like cAMP-binding protein
MKRLTENYSCQQCSALKQSVYNRLDESGSSQLESSKTCFSFKRGETLFYEGHTPQGVFCVKEGKVKISRTGSEGKEQIIRFSKSGDLIGYRSLLSGERYMISATALEETHVCYVPKHNILSLVEGHPCLSMNLMRMVCKELGEADKLITNLAQKNVRERMAEILLMLKSTFGETQEGALDIRLSREEIANLVGTATESTIRVLSDFQEEGYLSLQGKQIFLKNIVGLVKLGKIED